MYLYVLIESAHCCKLNIIKAMWLNCVWYDVLFDLRSVTKLADE